MHNTEITAVLGPTNTGKTYLAIERMLNHESGIIGLPLRLLAREVYNKISERAGKEKVALITGEERIHPVNACYFVCTVEAMPNHTDSAFVAIDEIQVATDFERGHIFTDRLLNLRGQQETLLLGSETMRDLIGTLLPKANIVTRPRMSVLAYTGNKKLTRLPRKSAIVTFSQTDVYATADLIRRQHGGAAVVLGSLSPRTRNKQVELYQNGDVDYIIATDAIGMGLNLDIKHVSFASDRKFDGFQFRKLSAAEIGQIAGRAGRHLQDGTFGVSGTVEPFAPELVKAIEHHNFEPVKVLQWRNSKLDFSSIEDLKKSLEQPASQEGLTRAPISSDWHALERVSQDLQLSATVKQPEHVELLWQVCCIPDYRNISPAEHVELITKIFSYLIKDGEIDTSWFAQQVKRADKPDGDIDTLSARISEIRSWTYVANRDNWLKDAHSWQEATRQVEDRLSDALHEKLTQKFVDRRTSILMRHLKQSIALDAEINEEGALLVEGHHVGHLTGFCFKPDAKAHGKDAKTLRTTAEKALINAILEKAQKLIASPDEDFILVSDYTVHWENEVVAKIIPGTAPLNPKILLLCDEHLNGPIHQQVKAHLQSWLDTYIKTHLKPLFDLTNANHLPGLARGITYRTAEQFGILSRKEVADELHELAQEARADLRQLGIRFGTYHIYVPSLLKPTPSKLLVMLYALFKNLLGKKGLEEIPALSAAGRTSLPVDPEFLPEIYQIAGYKICSTRAVRIDILERLADLIRPLLAWRPTQTETIKPDGAVEEYGFTVTTEMTSLLGCSGEEMKSVLKNLGYHITHKHYLNIAPKPDNTSHAASDNCEDEQSVIEVWQPKKLTSKSQKTNRKKRNGQQQTPKNSKAHLRSKQHRRQKSQSSSPFAALAKLKEQIANPNKK